jgi:signal transduction histidine kinase
MHNDTLRGAIGLISPSDGPQLSAEEIESVRQLAYDAAPILSRLQEIDALTTKNHALSAANERIADTQHKMANVIAERNHFDALLKIGWHVQSNIAHELRTPLAAVRGYARMILDGRTGEISDTQRDYLRIIHENTNRLINIANWMTHLADLSAQNFTVAPCDLRKIWAETLRKNQQVLLSKSLTVVEKIPEQSFEIVADAEKLAYGLKELISAAANLSEAGSGITAEFSRGRQHEVMVKISVTGAGVAPEMPSKTPQHSTDSGVQTTGHTDVQKSLNAINEVVGIHGGRMFVNNTAGQGSMLLFTLPAVTLGGEDKSNEQAVNIGRR